LLFKTTGLSLKSDWLIGMLFQNQQGGGCILQISFFIKHILPYFPSYHVSPEHSVSMLVYGTLPDCIFSLLMSLTAFWNETRKPNRKKPWLSPPLPSLARAKRKYIYVAITFHGPQKHWFSHCCLFRGDG
jgi:hypothetical protein